MRKIMTTVLLGIFFAASAYAQNITDDTTAQELSTLRKKLSRVQREMNLLMKDVISNASTVSDMALNNFGGDVNVDILQNDKDVIVRADLPGMQKDKIDITLENNRLLKIAGSREMMKSERSPGVVKQERFSGRFEKVLELPCEVENAGINAVYKDGVLEVTIPKRAKAKEESVKINVQ